MLLLQKKPTGWRQNAKQEDGIEMRGGKGYFTAGKAFGLYLPNKTFQDLTSLLDLLSHGSAAVKENYWRLLGPSHLSHPAPEKPRHRRHSRLRRPRRAWARVRKATSDLGLIHP